MTRNSALFIILPVAVFFFAGCKSAKVVQVETPIFKIEEASFHKIVPGEESREATVKLSVFLNDLDVSFNMDSLLFKGNTVVPHVKKINEKMLLIVEIKESTVKSNQYKSIDIKNNDALLFYSANKKSWFYHLKGIKKNADVYLP